MCVELDAGLLQRARRGDEDAFSELFRRHRQSIFRYALYMGGHELADDVVQETFLAVLQTWPTARASRSGSSARCSAIERDACVGNRRSAD